MKNRRKMSLFHLKLQFSFYVCFLVGKISTKNVIFIFSIKMYENFIERKWFLKNNKFKMIFQWGKIFAHFHINPKRNVRIKIFLINVYLQWSVTVWHRTSDMCVSFNGASLLTWLITVDCHRTRKHGTAC